MTGSRGVQAIIAARAELPGGFCLLNLAASGWPTAITPGQFAMARCAEGYDPYLRRPLPFAGAHGDTVSFLFPTKDAGQQWLAQRPLGTKVDLLAPLGNAFPLPPTTRHLLLASEDGPLAPLFFLAERALERDVAVTLALGPALQELTPVVPQVVELAEVQESVWPVVSHLLSWADQVAVAGDLEALHNLAGLLPNVRPGTVYAWLEAPMGCGVGSCGSCISELRCGPRRVCVAGPVFDLTDLVQKQSPVGRR